MTDEAPKKAPPRKRVRPARKPKALPSRQHVDNTMAASPEQEHSGEEGVTRAPDGFLRQIDTWLTNDVGVRTAFIPGEAHVAIYVHGEQRTFPIISIVSPWTEEAQRAVHGAFVERLRNEEAD